MNTIKRTAAVVAAVPFILVGSAWAASATDHSDPCPGDHIQVWADLGGKGIDNGKAEATDHFVCGSDLKGEKGDAGVQGPAGKDGKDGADGAAGADGVAAVGPAGPAGAAGATGEAGVAGPVGPAGADGAAGAVGPAGKAGVNGTVGAAGHDGLNGKDGVDGSQGPAGRNADGTKPAVEPVVLPHTGASDNWAIAAAGLVAIAAGASFIVFTTRRRGNHSA